MEGALERSAVVVRGVVGVDVLLLLEPVDLLVETETFSFVLVGVLVGVVDLKVGGNLNFLAGARFRRSNVDEGGGRGNFLVVLAERGDKDASGLLAACGVFGAEPTGDGATAGGAAVAGAGDSLATVSFGGATAAGDGAIGGLLGIAPVLLFVGADATKGFPEAAAMD